MLTVKLLSNRHVVLIHFNRQELAQLGRDDRERDWCLLTGGRHQRATPASKPVEVDTIPKPRKSRVSGTRP
ncbi:hypothetical protein FD37_GL001548 [Levilactobacillus spicheri DSM 15429]|uniref:Uncharacterized protein n=1 Tax=Levilactobacillus spicheri DSM 15429 TaxID=1423805 RepID=A0A0R1QW14_9LACO|nr:hypothetical protein FD37_GL001548 [Levilactobacillus spicheri DSM 15429]